MITPDPVVYAELLASLTLTDQDRENLNKERGFTDDTIKKLKFKSAQKSNSQIIEFLTNKYGFGRCFECGLVDKAEQPAWQFTNDGLIVIPFLEADCTTPYFFKSHKYGSLTGADPLPYSQMIYRTVTSDTIVLCEGEFKAAAMWQMGYKAIGLGGITTFAGEYINTLCKMLYAEKPKNIIILFDTETQEDPIFKDRYKDDYKRRYAQHIWAYIMAKKITFHMLTEQNGFSPNVTIASLPKSWEIDGKADIDGCVATGKGRREFDIVLRDSLHPDNYRRRMDVPDKFVPWINRQMARAFKSEVLFERDNCYYVREKHKNEWVTKEISSFNIKIKNILQYKDKVYRDVQLVNRFGDRTPPFALDPKYLSSSSAFKELGITKGDYIWKGTDAHLNILLESLQLDSDAVPIKILDHIGRLEEIKAWAFGNKILFDDGREGEPDKNGTYWDGDNGYRISPLSDSPLPALSTEPIDVDEVVQMFHKAWGIHGVMCVAFSVCCLFSNEVFKIFKAFPFSMVYGEMGAGKSTMADICMLINGFGFDNPALNISNTTEVAMCRKLSYYSSLPVRFDEQREGNKKIEQKESMLRSIYNRQMSSKGTRDPMQVYEVKIRGIFTLSGEQRLEDPALKSRCVPLYLTRAKNDSPSYQAMQDLFKMGTKLSYISYMILKKYKELAKKFSQDMIDTRLGLNDITSIKGDFRTQQHYAMLIASLPLFLSKDLARKYQAEFFNMFKAYTTEMSHGSVLGLFFRELATMRAEDILTFNRYCQRDDRDATKAFIYLEGLHSEWMKWRVKQGLHKGTVPLDTLKEYLKSQKYVFESRCQRRVKIGDKSVQVRMMKIDLSHVETPLGIREIYETYTEQPDESDSENEPRDIDDPGDELVEPNIN